MISWPVVTRASGFNRCFLASCTFTTAGMSSLRTKPWTTTLCGLLLLAAAASAFDFAALKPEGYVSDFARVIDASSKQDLERYCGRVEAVTGAQIALVTIETLEGEPVEDVANALFRKWGIGKKGKDEGIMLLLVTRDRRSRLEIGYGLEPILPDGLAGSILREMRPALKANDFGDALKAAAQHVGSTIAAAKGVRLDAPMQPARRRETGPAIPWSIVAFAGFIILASIVRRRRYYSGGGGGFLPGLLLGNMMGRRGWGDGGGTSGGGFGGYDSGDTFGGFGGGDSGGGGASSDW